MSRKLRYLTEYGLLRTAIFLFDLLPIAAAERVISRLADAWYICHASRRRTAKENIARAGIASDPREIDRIARESFRHFAVLIIESMRSGRIITRDNWRNHVELEASPKAMAILNDPEQAVILTTGHVGNWEIGACVVSYMKPVVAVVRPMNNPYVERMLDKRNAKSNRTSIPKYDAGRTRFLSVLRAGKALGIVIDQHTHSGAMEIDFFGVPACTQTSHARLHRVMRTPIIFLACIRTGVMSYRLIVPDPVIHERTSDKEHDTRVVLEQCNRLLEDAIRRYPEQYLWAHRRWKNLP